MKLLSALVLSIAASSLVLSTLVAPVLANSFNPENIIDDQIFTNKDAISAGGIQAFLNTRNSTCLKNYQTPEPLGNNQYGGNVSAAQAIWKAGQLYNINPQVLLVTLQKEQGLITRSDCPTWRYNAAMGFGCPDGAPCDAQWYGLSKQLYQGARHFRGFYDVSPGWYVPYKTGNHFVRYNPNTGCGGTTLNIRNRSTGSLYSYTPYQPNAAALNAGYGSGDGCSAYGNRNFFLYFRDWFGFTHTNPEGDDDRDAILNKYDLCLNSGGPEVRWGCPQNDIQANNTYSGDFNGDGFGDVVSLSAFPDGKTFNVWLYKGSTTGLENPVFQFTLGPNFGGWDFSRSKFTVANVNGDAFLDIVAFHKGPSNEVVRHVLKGSASGIQASDPDMVDWQFPSQGWLWSNLRITGGGDFNGDGYGDVSLVSVNPDGKAYNVWMYEGSASGLENPTFQQALGPDNGGFEFKKSKFTVSNVNRDSYMDLIIFHQGSGNEVVRHVLKGSASGIQASDVNMVAYQYPSQGWLWSNIKLAGGGGDYNGDGYDDVVAFSLFPDGKTFNVWLYKGSTSGLDDPTHQLTLGPGFGGWNFNDTKTIPTNVNGGSYLDLVAFHKGPNNEVVRHVLKGSATGIQSTDESMVVWQSPNHGWQWSNIRITGADY